MSVMRARRSPFDQTHHLMRSWPLLLVLIAATCRAQQPWTLGLQAHHGFLWPHRPSSWILVRAHAPALALFAERRVDGTRSWHHRFLQPSYGASFLATGLGDPDRIGTTLRCTPYLYLPFHRWERSSFGLRAGWGIGYVSKPYDRDHNRQQVAIGSRVNTAISLALEYRMERGAWTGLAGIDADHWSNGSFKLPNLGLNYLSVHVGLARRLGEAKPLLAPVDTLVQAPHFERMVMLAGGINESSLPGSGQHSVFVLMAQGQWRMSGRSALAAGIDIFNKGSLATVHAQLRDRPRSASTQLGAHGGYALLLGGSQLYIQMGTYIYSPVTEEKRIFHRVGGRTRIGRHWTAGVALKSHFAVADHWEFGIGRTW